MSEKIPVNSIEIPGWIVELCSSWYSGIDCMLYAVSSTGGLTTGTNRPTGCNTEQWYLHIWREFSVDIGIARRAAFDGYNAEDDGGDGEGHDADYPALVRAEEWVESVCGDLEYSYGLEDWEG
jgi:hypothetical protein